MSGSELGATLVAELRVSTGEMAGERVSVVPTTWQAVDRFVLGRRFARGCRARIVRGSTTAPSLEPVYAVVFEGAGLAANSGPGTLHPDSPTPEQLRFRRCFPENDPLHHRRHRRADEPGHRRLLGQQLPDLGQLGPVKRFELG